MFQWPCGANLRNRCPFGDHPRSGAMLVLIHVSWIKTRRWGSRCPITLFQRRRLRATSARPCSIPNSVFFEAQPFPAQKKPYRIVGNKDAMSGKNILQAMQSKMGCGWNCVTLWQDNAGQPHQNHREVSKLHAWQISFAILIQKFSTDEIPNESDFQTDGITLIT